MQENMNPKLGKDDTPMNANCALVIEPAASGRRLQESNEFFFEDLDAQMTAPSVFGGPDGL